MKHYSNPDLYATIRYDQNTRRGRVTDPAEPTLPQIERAIKIQVKRLENPALAGDGHREVWACLEKLTRQYRQYTGHRFVLEAT